MINSISELITRPWTTFVLFAAVRLKVFTILDGRDKTAAEVAGECGGAPHLVEALLNACVAMGLLNLRDNTYGNAHFSQVHLVEGKPRYMGDFIDILSGESVKWLNLTNLILGKPTSVPSPAPYDLDTAAFTRGMNNMGMLGEAEALKNAVDLTGCREMIDAGGGSGLYSRVLCQAYPDLKSTILDVPEALAVAREIISRSEVAERIRFRAADITRDAFGEEIDVVLLSDITYDKIESEKVLHLALDCLQPGGLLVLRGYHSDPGGANPLFGSLFALNMLSSDPNREILTVSSLQQCVNDTGFDHIELDGLTEYSCYLTARKP